ncbi:MAG TPA: hypothetical protein VMX55_00710 [candidate division Zixibacteria bacterium]|nr:hypothetical protein [candidate division Zixibacteria bacterium]
MTTIVEMPLRYNIGIKRIMDSREEFYNKIKSSQFITYTLEYFADCFTDDPRLLKAVNVKVYNLAQSQRPDVNQFTFTWEDVPRKEEENWQEFRMKVDSQLKKFLNELNDSTNAIEGKIL